MKTESEIRAMLEACKTASAMGRRRDYCPMDEHGYGLHACEECTTPATLEWVLRDSKRGHG
jgi:hypothetical protein